MVSQLGKGAAWKAWGKRVSCWGLTDRPMRSNSRGSLKRCNGTVDPQLRSPSPLAVGRCRCRQQLPGGVKASASRSALGLPGYPRPSGTLLALTRRVTGNLGPTPSAAKLAIGAPSGGAGVPAAAAAPECGASSTGLGSYTFPAVSAAGASLSGGQSPPPERVLLAGGSAGGGRDRLTSPFDGGAAAAADAAVAFASVGVDGAAAAHSGGGGRTSQVRWTERPRSLPVARVAGA